MNLNNFISELKKINIEITDIQLEQLNKYYETSLVINIEDFEELEQAGYEKDMGDMIMAHPHMIEEGFKPTAREYSTEHGFIDILGKDAEGNLMILELKCRKAGVSAVKQIRRYLSDFENNENMELKGEKEKQKIRGLLVAPSIGDDALELLEEEGIEFVAVDPPKELKRDKKVTLDAFI